MHRYSFSLFFSLAVPCVSDKHVPIKISALLSDVSQPRIATRTEVSVFVVDVFPHHRMSWKAPVSSMCNLTTGSRIKADKISRIQNVYTKKEKVRLPSSRPWLGAEAKSQQT